MKKNLCKLLFLISIVSFSQNSNKKTVYYFQNNEISEKEYEAFDARKIYTTTNATDSSQIKTIYLHKNNGKLDSIQLQQIRMFLTKIIGSDFNQEKRTMIHLYSKNGKSVHDDSKNKKYWKWIKKNSNRYQSFLIGTKDSQIEPNKKNQIYLDQYNLLEKLFFKSSNFNINHLFIKPNGDLYIYFGIDDISRVLDWSVD